MVGLHQALKKWELTLYKRLNLDVASLSSKLKQLKLMQLNREKELEEKEQAIRKM